MNNIPDASFADVLDIYVDEAGDPTLFDGKGEVLVDSRGCTRFFILGKLEVNDHQALSSALTGLRQELLGDPYFAGVESFRPERKKTALLFHAKDDVPEVRYMVYRLLRQFGSALRFHAVVCDKVHILRYETAKRATAPGYRYNPNELYDGLVRNLFGTFHHIADRYQLCIAQRGEKDRNRAIAQALEHAELDFEQKFGFSRGGIDCWKITISNPETFVCLQAVDYFLWAVQRFYEARFDHDGNKLRDPATGLEIREERYLKMIWPQIGEIHDLHFGPSSGTFFTAQKSLCLEERFGVTKKKMSRV